MPEPEEDPDESEDFSAESDDEPGDEPGEDPGEALLAEPLAANSVGPGKEPLPATAQEFAAQVLNRKPN